MSPLDDLSIRAASKVYCQESPDNWSEMSKQERQSWVTDHRKPEFDHLNQEQLVSQIEAEAESARASMAQAMQMLSGGQGMKTEDSADLVAMAGLI